MGEFLEDHRIRGFPRSQTKDAGNPSITNPSYKVVVPPTYAGWVQSRLDVRFLVESHACEQVNINQRL